MKVLMLLRSPIDHDSRVKKEIRSLKKLGLSVKLLSINSSDFNETQSYTLSYKSTRRLIPGISTIYAFFQFMAFAIRHYENEQCIHCHDLNTLAIGCFLKLTVGRNKIGLIYDTHEYAVNDVPNESKFSQLRKYLIEKIFIKLADEVICVSASIAEKYSNLYNIEIPKVVLNCPPLTDTSEHDIFRKNFCLGSEVQVFLYQGGFFEGRGITILADAFASYRGTDKVIVFMGFGPLEGLVKTYADKSTNIFFQKAVSQEDLYPYTASADVGILFYEDNCVNHQLCLPNKMFEYMMAGLPVISSNLLEMKRLISLNAIGTVAEENTVSGFLRAVSSLDNDSFEEYRINVAKTRSTYTWEAQEVVLKQSYNNIMLCKLQES